MVFTSKPTTISVSTHLKEGLAKREDAGPVALTSVERKDYTFIKTHFATREMQDTIFYFDLPTAGNYRLYLGRFNQAPIQWTISTGGALVYINKKNVIHHAIKLIDERQSNYSNYRLGIYANKQFETIQMLPVKNTAFWSIRNKTIPFESNNNSSYRNKPIIGEHNLPSFLYYQNEVMRWPAITLNTPPYFFFVK